MGAPGVEKEKARPVLRKTSRANTQSIETGRSAQPRRTLRKDVSFGCFRFFGAMKTCILSGVSSVLAVVLVFHRHQLTFRTEVDAFTRGQHFMSSFLRVSVLAWFGVAACFIVFDSMVPLALPQQAPVISGVRITDGTMPLQEWQGVVEAVLAQHIQSPAHAQAIEEHRQAANERAAIRAELATSNAMRQLELAAMGAILIGIYGPALARTLRNEVPQSKEQRQ